MKTERILSLMNILTWIVFILLLIQAGTLLINFIFSFINIDNASDLYKGLNLLELREKSLFKFTTVCVFLFASISVKAYTAHLVITIINSVDLQNPFTRTIAYLMERISLMIMAVWIIEYISNFVIKMIVDHGKNIKIIDFTGEYIFLAGVIYIIAQIFKRGIEIQSENELTV